MGSHELKEALSAFLDAEVVHLEDAVTRLRADGSPTWRAVVRGGRAYLVKRVGAAEMAAARALSAHAPRVVPKLVNVHEPSGLIALEWLDAYPLDDVLQGSGEEGALGEALLAAYAQLEAGFLAAARELAPYSTPLPDARQALEAAALQASAGLRWLARHLGRALPESWERELGDCVERLAQRPRTLGSLDVNARNALVCNQRCFFVDFSLLGLDWPERRLVAYGSALGAYRHPPGRFASAFGRERLDMDAARAAALDGHDLLAWGVVALRVAAAIEAPQSAPGAAMRASWGDPAHRIPQLQALIGRPLSPATEALRAPFARS